jgi:hypothetical protein
MPKYAALLYRDEAIELEPTSPERQTIFQEWGKFNKQIAEAGIMTNGTGLAESSTATTVRVRDSKTLTTDGPFAETKEQLGGVFIFDCKDLDEAIEWASKIPTARYGSIEIRPLWGE